VTETVADRAFARGPKPESRATEIARDVIGAAGPALLFGIRLWVSVCLALYVAFWLQLDNPSWAGATAAIVCQPHVGASLRKGWYRMIGTLVGAVFIVVLTALFPQDRVLFLGGLALWGGFCALSTTVLRNFAAYAAALAGYTATIIASDALGATGGPNANEVFTLAVTRANEICIGIISAGVVLAGTDFGTARRELAGSFAALSAEITGRFLSMLTAAGPNMPQTHDERRELVRRVVALDPMVDMAKGESSQIRYHSPVLQSAMDGLFAALVAWRAVAVLLAAMPKHRAKQDADGVLDVIPTELRAARHGVPPEWNTAPGDMRGCCDEVGQQLENLPAATPALRLLADETAKLLAGISNALDALALLTGAPIRIPPRHTKVRIRVADWLPALVNAGRAVLSISAVALFWIATEWPSGGMAITFAAITVILYTPQADRAYDLALTYVIGTMFGMVLTAVLAFAILPKLETFEAFCIALGVYLVPIGALTLQPWQTMVFSAMIVQFVPLLSPNNQMNYDTVQFYNTALAILAGTAVGALSFRLLPSFSPGFRTRRLLSSTLRELRHVAESSAAWTVAELEGRIYGRLQVLPDEAEPIERAHLLAALTVGSEIIRLRDIAPRFGSGFGSRLETAFAAIRVGDSRTATARLAELDARLATPRHHSDASKALRARASICAMAQALEEHSAYFDARGLR
jgi:uncharacterized membrane protein YccC